jgi:hypothetical protein
MRRDAIPERESTTTRTFAQWCKANGYDPKTRTYHDPNPHTGAVPHAHETHPRSDDPVRDVPDR